MSGGFGGRFWIVWGCCYVMNGCGYGMSGYGYMEFEDGGDGVEFPEHFSNKSIIRSVIKFI